jgi:hypothetical protein
MRRGHTRCTDWDNFVGFGRLGMGGTLIAIDYMQYFGGFIMSKDSMDVAPPAYFGVVSGRVSVAMPLPHPADNQEAPRAHNELTSKEATLLWHFLSGAAELRDRIDFAIIYDIKRFGRLPAPATMEVLIAAREMSIAAQNLLEETPALLSRLMAMAEKVVAEEVNDAGRE